MIKFNWDRFYGELEEGDPKKFPYWMFFIHEILSIIPHFVSGFVLVILTLLTMGTSFAVLAKHYPDFTFKLFQAGICEDYKPITK